MGKFRGHETFYIRKGWLYKGLKTVESNSTIFSDRAINPADIFGMGVNMIKSLRYWLQAVGLTTEERRGYTYQLLTPMGELIFNHDKYMEEIGTLCLLPRKDISLVKDGSQVFSPTKYANEHIYMFAGESKNFILKLYNERVVGDIVDWFGKSVKIFEQDGNTLAEVKTNENAMIYWALQYGEDVEIIEPLETREKIKNILKDMVKKYE